MSETQEKLNEQLFNVIKNDKDSDEARLKKVKYMVRLGADVNTKLYGKSVLSKAIENEAGVEVQNFLRENGANEWVISKEEALEVSQVFWNENGKIKSVEEIKELLKKGADVNASDKYGDTALMVAATLGKLDIVKCLVELGADLEAKDGAGRTALMMVANWGKLDVVKCLAECGADLEAKDMHGRTALMWAATEGQIEVVKYLAECGADVNAKDEWYGETALMKAARDGNLDMVKYLVEEGAQLEVKCENCETAKEVAKNWKRYDCVEFLEEAQKKVSAQKTKGDKTGASQIAKADEGR